MPKIEKILRIEEKELLKCVSFDNSFAKKLHISFEMEDGTLESLDYETFQKCVRNSLHLHRQVNFNKRKVEHKILPDYEFCQTTETTAHFGINKGNGYIRVFRNLNDPDFDRYYTILFSVPNCSNYTIKKIWENFKHKTILGDWLDLSHYEINLLRQYFTMLNN